MNRLLTCFLMATAITLSSTSSRALDSATLDIPALPVGKQITLFFDAAVAKPVSPGTISVLTQGTVSGANVTSVLTDDPGTVATNDATILAIANTPPSLSSIVTAAPNPATVGQTVQFGAGASDAELDAVSFLWDFQDGTNSTLQNPTHSFATPGTYVVGLNLDDGRGGRTTGSVSVDVGSGVLAEGDADGDGFMDEIEAALNSDPFNANSRPMGLPKPLATAKFLFPTLAIHLDFSQTKKDSILLTGQLPVNNVFPVSPIMIVDVGGVVKSFTVSSMGTSQSGVSDRVSLKVKKGRVQVIKSSPNFKLHLSKGNFASALADEQLTSTAANRAQRLVNVTIIFLNTVYKGSVAQVYTVKKSIGTTTTPK